MSIFLCQKTCPNSWKIVLFLIVEKVSSPCPLALYSVKVTASSDFPWVFTWKTVPTSFPWYLCCNLVSDIFIASQNTEFHWQSRMFTFSQEPDSVLSFSSPIQDFSCTYIFIQTTSTSIKWLNFWKLLIFLQTWSFLLPILSSPLRIKPLYYLTLVPNLFETFMGKIFFTRNQINFPSINSICVYFEHIYYIIEIQYFWILNLQLSFLLCRRLSCWVLCAVLL